MTDKNSQSAVSNCIDRRGLLSAVGGGMATFAGCSSIGGSSNGTASGPTATKSPSSQSDALKSLTFEPKPKTSPRVMAHVELAADSRITQIGLINGMGNEVHRAFISARETVASFLVARIGDDPSERITRGENTLVLVGEETDVEIPVTYSASLELQEVIGPDESDGFPPSHRRNRRHIGLIVENTGQHADIAQKVVSEDGPHTEAFDKTTLEYDLDSMIKPGERKLLPVRNYLAELFDCSESYTREASMTLQSAFSEQVPFTQTFSYNPAENSCSLSLKGNYTVVEQTETKTP